MAGELPEPPQTPRVVAGTVIAQRLHDVCYAIDLAQVEALWSVRAAGRTKRGQLVKTPPKAVAFEVPPVVIALEPVEWSIAGRACPAEVSARVYDFGVIALSLQFAASEKDWPAFTGLVNATGKAAEENPVWADLLEKVCEVIRPALTRPNAFRLEEDYLLAVVRQWSEAITAERLLETCDLVPLLSGETRPLAEDTRRELLRQRFSYYEDDLAVVTWDRAFIYEPGGDNEVCDVLEIANAQLLELRYYDELLDRELPRMYDLVEATRQRAGWRSPRRFAHLARTLYTLVAEVTELTEKAENALQVTEDVHLARIYAAALKLFRVPLVGAAVDRKLSIIRETYTALFDEASTARGELLEIAVIVLIVIEIVVALSFHA